jgi:hypothetical protein
LIVERELRGGRGLRGAYTLQGAQATATDAYELTRRIRLDPGGDTINPANIEFPLDYDRRHGLTLIAQGQVPDGRGPRIAGGRPLGGLEGAAIVRYNSGLPFTRTNATGDTLIGLPNSWRLPPTHALDLLVRMQVRVARARGALYLDVRNVLNRRNVEAVRRDTGRPELTNRSRRSPMRRAGIPRRFPRVAATGPTPTDHNGLRARQSRCPRTRRPRNTPLFAYGRRDCCGSAWKSCSDSPVRDGGGSRQEGRLIGFRCVCCRPFGAGFLAPRPRQRSRAG